MASYTTNLNLKKPASSDYVDIGDINDNSDILDAAVAGKQAQHLTLTITILSTDWSNDSATVTATGVTASNTVIVSPASASADDYGDAGITCTAQATNALTFTCTTAPSTNVDVNVIILD